MYTHSEPHMMLLTTVHPLGTGDAHKTQAVIELHIPSQLGRSAAISVTQVVYH
jgi:hypothetical protein